MQQCPVAGVTNHLKVGGLKQQIFILVQFWKPKDRNQGVSKATLPPKALRKTLPSFSELLVALSNHCPAGRERNHIEEPEVPDVSEESGLEKPAQGHLPRTQSWLPWL